MIYSVGCKLTLKRHWLVEADNARQAKEIAYLRARNYFNIDKLGLQQGDTLNTTYALPEKNVGKIKGLKYEGNSNE